MSDDLEVSHSGQLHRFAKPEPNWATWVQIPPPPQILQTPVEESFLIIWICE